MIRAEEIVNFVEEQVDLHPVDDLRVDGLFPGQHLAKLVQTSAIVIWSEAFSSTSMLCAVQYFSPMPPAASGATRFLVSGIRSETYAMEIL